MIKNFLLLIPFVIGVLPCMTAQTIMDTMYFDLNWAQSDKDNASYYRVIRTSGGGDFLFIVEDYYLSGQIQMTGGYRSIRPDYREGVFTWWYDNGQRQAECTYHENDLDGPYKEWYREGQLKSSHSFRHGLLHGSFQSWKPDGTPELEIQYSMGKKHGHLISYHPNGKPLRKDLYEDDKLIEGKCFNQSGDPVDYYPYLIMPAYRGGKKALLEFIEKELRYPPDAASSGTEGLVFVRFTVDEKGRVKDPVIIKRDLDFFNEEALRLVSSMPRWIPGKIDNQPSPVELSIPVEFRLN